MSLNEELSITDDEIILLCDAPSACTLDEGRRVVRISPDLVAKFGQDVTKEEARNQCAAHKLFHPNTCIPRVHRFFERKRDISPEYFNKIALHNGYSTTIGYLIMEYVEGEAFPPHQYKELVPRVLEALSQMQKLISDTPGPVDTGPSRGIFWEDDYPAFLNKNQLEEWINERLRLDGRRASLGSLPLVFSHLDLTPRNIIRTKTGSLCFLDWASAGFYPRIFELAVLKLRPLDDFEKEFNELLIRGYVLSKEEEGELEIISIAWENSQRFAL